MSHGFIDSWILSIQLDRITELVWNPELVTWKHESCRHKCLVVKLISLSRFLKVWRHTWFPNLQCNLLMLQNGVIYHHYLNFASPETYLICTRIFKVNWLFWEFLRNSLGSLWGIVTDCSHIYLRILIKFSLDFDQKIWKWVSFWSEN